MSKQVLQSQQDTSVNFVEDLGEGNQIEARYVRRNLDYFIAYLSSQTGCKMACRMCHLTATRQINDNNIGLEGFALQAAEVLSWYDNQEPAKIVHFNFMARGEVFMNPLVLDKADKLISILELMATQRQLLPIYKFSTIMPRKAMADLAFTDIFRLYQPDLYVSLYSMDPAFRARWLPQAMEPLAILRKLYDWQQITHKIPVLHWAYIEGQNDSVADTEAICMAIGELDLRIDINIVRYNPFDARFGLESDISVIERNMALLRESLPGSDVHTIERVGFDVAASCGMFVK